MKAVTASESSAGDRSAEDESVENLSDAESDGLSAFEQVCFVVSPKSRETVGQIAELREANAPQLIVHHLCIYVLFNTNMRLGITEKRPLFRSHRQSFVTTIISPNTYRFFPSDSWRSTSSMCRSWWRRHARIGRRCSESASS